MVSCGGYVAGGGEAEKVAGGVLREGRRRDAAVGNQRAVDGGGSFIVG